MKHNVLLTLQYCLTAAVSFKTLFALKCFCNFNHIKYVTVKKHILLLTKYYTKSSYQTSKRTLNLKQQFSSI